MVRNVPHGSTPVEREETGTELRAAPRYTMLIRTAKLVTPSGEFLCVLRDASATGIKVKIFHPLPPGSRMQLELADGERFAIEKMWETNGSAGFRFETPIDIERFLADAPNRLRKRSIRLKFVLPAMLHAHGESVRITFRDISQQGACIQCDTHLAVDERIRLESDHLPTIDAKVRWRRQGLYGLIFEQTFRFEELAVLAAALQPRAEAADNKIWRLLDRLTSSAA